MLFLWWRVARGLGARLRGVLRGEGPPVERPRLDLDRRPDIAPETISLVLSDAPVVSVIIPTYGQTQFTLRCLASIQTHPPVVLIEVIVVDDAFPGTETDCLSRVPGIRLLRNEVNLGFIRTCNAAARTARGAFVLFLNNDTQVLPGWLDRMVEVFAARPDAGIVGSKLIGEDGMLREAGAILWQDGSAWNYGLGGDPDAPEFNYMREADYCSGASLLVRRTVFLGMGGFDEKYVPAYCEDSDLSFRLREMGLKTYYQPRSEVIHFEGISHGRDLTRGVKAFQVTNQARFLDTWHAVLTRDHFLNGTHVPRARDRAHDRKVVLIVDHYVPQPDRDAGSCAIVAVIRALLSTGLVVKFWPFNLYKTPVYTEILQDMGVEVLYGPHQTTLSAWLKVNGADLDIVVLSRPDVAEICLPMVRAGTAARIVYYGHDLHFRRMAAQAEVSGDERLRWEAGVMKNLELRIWRDADVVLYLSEEEADIVRDLAPSVTVRAVVPYAFEEREQASQPHQHAPQPSPHAPQPSPHEGDDLWIVFVAGFGHPPNADGAAWFVHEVLPSIVARLPAVRLAIVGSNPSPVVEALCGRNVSLFANVTDAELLAWYRRATVAVVPLLAGAGVKLKTVEALWHGVPAVLTPAGAQGLPDIGSVVPVETEPAAFAAAVCDLLTDRALWRLRSVAETKYARERFGAAAQRRSLLSALDIDAPHASSDVMKSSISDAASVVGASGGTAAVSVAADCQTGSPITVSMTSSSVRRSIGLLT
jgi:GT2 family glycosyltransferase/glycosyltransferase involved in cell wall biosynthesis